MNKYLRLSAPFSEYWQLGWVQNPYARTPLKKVCFLSSGWPKFWQNEKKSSHSAVLYTPGRWTGNNIFLRVALVFNYFLFALYDITCTGINLLAMKYFDMD